MESETQSIFGSFFSAREGQTSPGMSGGRAQSSLAVLEDAEASTDSLQELEFSGWVSGLEAKQLKYWRIFETLELSL